MPLLAQAFGLMPGVCPAYVPRVWAGPNSCTGVPRRTCSGVTMSAAFLVRPAFVPVPVVRVLGTLGGTSSYV